MQSYQNINVKRVVKITNPTTTTQLNVTRSILWLAVAKYCEQLIHIIEMTVISNIQNLT